MVFAVASIRLQRSEGSIDMITTPSTDTELSLSRRFATLADEQRLARATAALEANGMMVLRARDAADAKRIVLGLVPEAAEVHHGAS
jgi:hypothetical protein